MKHIASAISKLEAVRSMFGDKMPAVAYGMILGALDDLRAAAGDQLVATSTSSDCDYLTEAFIAAMEGPKMGRLAPISDFAMSRLSHIAADMCYVLEHGSTTWETWVHDGGHR